LDNFIVHGVWATGEAQPTEDPLDVVISIDTSFADEPIGFLPSVLSEKYTNYISSEFSDWFPAASVVATYDDEFDETIDIVSDSSGSNKFYFVLDDNLRELES